MPPPDDRPPDPQAAWQKAATIGAPGIGSRYLTPLNPTTWDLIKEFFGGERPQSVAAQDPYGIQAWEAGTGPLPGFAGTTAPVGELSHLAIAPVERVGGRLIVSPRIPYAKEPVAATGGPLMMGLADVVKDAPELIAKYAKEIRTYPLLTSSEKRLSDRGVVQAFMARAGENTEALISMQPKALVARMRKWYRGAHDIANRFATQFNITGDQAAASLAIQSGTKDWNQNITITERLIKWWREFEQKHPEFRPELTAQHAQTTHAAAYRKIEEQGLRQGSAEANKIVQGADLAIAETNGYTGRAWKELPLEQQARMIRAHSELVEPQTYSIWTPEGEVAVPVAMTKGGKKPSGLQWQTYESLADGLSVLHDPSDANISLRLGRGPKKRSFFNNINVPMDPRSTTVDTHDVAGSLMLPYGGSQRPVLYVMGDLPGHAASGIKGGHPLYHEATTQAAEALGWVPNQLQSVKWETIKGLFSPTQRSNPAFRETVEKLRQDYSRGTIGAEEFYARVYDLAGGLTPPAWAARVQGGTP